MKLKSIASPVQLALAVYFLFTCGAVFGNSCGLGLRQYRETPAASAPSLAVVTIRTAIHDDAPNIIRFIRQIRTKLGVDPDVTADGRSLFSDLANFAENFNAFDGEFFVLKDASGEILGSAAFVRIDSTTCELKKFYLDSSLRGKGLGVDLLKHVIAAASEAQFKRMILQTDTTMNAAIGLYERFGFKKIPSTGPLRALYYSLDL